MEALETAIFILIGLLMYVLFGMLGEFVFEIINDNCKLGLNVKKYSIAIVLFWPFVPVIIIVIGFWQVYQLIRALILRF